jgi:hypothetical protein
MLIWIYNEDTADTPTVSGFTMITLTAASNHNFSVGWKRLSANDTGNYTITFSGSGAWREAICQKYTGVITSGNPYDFAPNGANSGSSSVTASPNVSGTTVTANVMLAFGASNFNGGAWTPPASFTERFDISTGITESTLVQAAAGATGNKSATCASSGQSCSFLFPLKPAGGTTISGDVATTFAFSSTGAAKRGRYAASATTFAFSSTAAGKRTRNGAVATTFVFSSTGAGTKVAKQGAVSTAFAFSSTATGKRTVKGAVSSLYSFAISATGKATRYGGVSTTFVYASLGSGTVIPAIPVTPAPVTLPHQAYWGQVGAYGWGQLATWADPLADVYLDAAYAGAVAHGGPLVVVNWGAGDVVDTIETTYLRDRFDRVVASGWGGDWSASGAAYSVDGSSAIMSHTYPYSGKSSTIVAESSDIDTRFKMALDHPVSQGLIFLELRFRRRDINNYYAFQVAIYSSGLMILQANKLISASSTVLATEQVPVISHQANTFYWIRCQSSYNQYRMKIWLDGTVEPETWNMHASEVSPDSTYAGDIQLATFCSTGIFPLDTTPSHAAIGLEIQDFFNAVTYGLAANAVTTSLSLDDGLPSGVNDTNATGIAEANAALGGTVTQPASWLYSQFRTDAPFYDLPRDTAGVAVKSTVVAPDGIRNTRMFTGQMADIPLTGRDAALTAVSRNRLSLSTLVLPPAINATYEGCDASWPISYALYKSGVHLAPPTRPGCRLSIPFHGSVHPMLPDDNSLSIGVLPGGVYETIDTDARFIRPEFTEGPWLLGVDVGIDSEKSRQFQNIDQLRLAPGSDLFSQASSAGRVEFWVRGDATDVPNSPLAASPPGWLTEMLLHTGDLSFIQIGIGYPDRIPIFRIYDGANLTELPCPALPTDGHWHFLGFAWDVALGRAWVRMDDVDIFSSTLLAQTVGNLNLAEKLPFKSLKTYLPMADFQLTAEPFMNPSGLSNITPWLNDPEYFTAEVVMRPSVLQLNGLAETEYREAFEVIQDYAQGELAKTGFDRYDRFAYLPMPYWVEPEQQSLDELLDTDDNLGIDLHPSRPVERIYNSVSVGYRDTKAPEIFRSVYSGSDLIAMPPGGMLTLDIPLSLPTIQLADVNFDVVDGPTLAIAPVGYANNFNYVSANTEPDGTGTYSNSSNFSARIVAWDPGRATVVITNNNGVPVFITNDVSLPSLNIAGKALSIADAVATASDPTSIAQRGVRGLQATLKAIQRPDQASAIARELCARFCQPQTVITGSVFGDPRRQPGSIVKITDLDGTGIDEMFRLTSVNTTQTDAEMAQAFRAEKFWPVAVWDETNWDEGVWGA